MSGTHCTSYLIWIVSFKFPSTLEVSKVEVSCSFKIRKMRLKKNK